MYHDSAYPKDSKQNLMNKSENPWLLNSKYKTEHILNVDVYVGMCCKFESLWLNKGLTDEIPSLSWYSKPLFLYTIGDSFDTDT